MWNYLDSPAGLPHPSHTYWMPLASILAAVVPGIVGLQGFELARLPFILIAGMVAPLTAALAYSHDCQKKNAIIAGLLAVFPGYYLAYYPTTDTFAIYMVLGTIFLLLGKKFLTSTAPRQYCNGIFIGVGHWLDAPVPGRRAVMVRVCLWINALRGYTSRKVNIPGVQSGRFSLLVTLGAGLVGYLVPMGAWLTRNVILYGSLMAPGGSHALWVRSYNQLFLFPADTLTFQYWWAQGAAAILSARLQALLLNLKTAVGVQFGIVFLPFALIGAWKFRKNPVVQLGVHWLGWHVPGNDTGIPVCRFARRVFSQRGRGPTFLVVPRPRWPGNPGRVGRPDAWVEENQPGGNGISDQPGWCGCPDQPGFRIQYGARRESKDPGLESGLGRIETAGRRIG